VNRQSSLRIAVAFLFAVTAFAALAFAGAGARAQNSNSSTTAEDSTQNANANTTPTRRGRGRRGRRPANANTGDANANTGDATTTTTDTGMGSGTGSGTGVGSGAGVAQADDNPTGDLSGERVDLSGTYTGHVTMSGGHEMSGDGTLTITGNQFTLEGQGMTHNGRVYAVVTRGYVGAAFYFSDISDPATNTPTVANVRARKSGERLTLTPVPNTRTRLTFGAAGRRPRARRGAMPTPDANSNTGDNSNTTPPR
jgi:hypothetical protein